MKIHYNSVPKPVNERLADGTYRANEDAVAVNDAGENWLAAAVSDGAGGSGIFSGEWANLLAKSVPDAPLASYANLSALLNRIWKPFYDDCVEKIAGDSLRSNKFYEEGSCATLAAVWLSKDGREMRWATYGDSCIFVFTKGYENCLLMQPLTQFADFQQFPMLVNWHEAYMNENSFRAGTFDLPEKSEIWLASDALSMHLWLLASAIESTAIDPQKLEGKYRALWEKHQETTPEHARNQLRALKSDLPKHFAWGMQMLEKQGMVVNDDCSLIVVG